MMLLTQHTNNMLKDVIKRYKLDSNAKGGQANYLMEADIEFWDNFSPNVLRRNKARILTKEKHQQLIDTIGTACQNASKDSGYRLASQLQPRIATIKRRLANFYCDIGAFDVQDLKNLYEDMPLVELVSENPISLILLRFYTELDLDKKEKFTAKMFSLLHQNDVELKIGGGIQRKNSVNAISYLTKVATSSIDTEDEEFKHKKDAYLLSKIAEEIENSAISKTKIPFILFFLGSFSQLKTTEKILLNFFCYLNLYSQSMVSLLTEAIKLIGEHVEDGSTMSSQKEIFEEAIEALNHVMLRDGMETIDFKRDIDVLSLDEASYEDLSEAELEELMLFLEDNEDELIQYFEDIEESNPLDDYSSELIDYSPYFVVVGSNQLMYRRFSTEIQTHLRELLTN